MPAAGNGFSDNRFQSGRLRVSTNALIAVKRHDFSFSMATFESRSEFIYIDELAGSSITRLTGKQNPASKSPARGAEADRAGNEPTQAESKACSRSGRSSQSVAVVSEAHQYPPSLSPRPVDFRNGTAKPQRKTNGFAQSFDHHQGF